MFSKIVGCISYFSKIIDWPLIMALFFIIMVLGLGVALHMRHEKRKKILSADLKARFTKAYLPVSYLDKNNLEIKDMWLNPNQYVIFSSLVNRIYEEFRHGLCSDSCSWNHFALLAGSEAYRRLCSEVDNDDLDVLLAKVVENYAIYYCELTFKDSFKNKNNSLESFTAVRGVNNRNVPKLFENVYATYVD